MTKPLEQPAGSVVLSVSVIADGKFYAAGSETPFTEETLPAHLREYLARGDEDFFTHASRNIYSGQPVAPEHFVYQGVSNSQWVQRQAGQVASAAQEQDWAAEHANEPLPKETLEVLQTKHDEHIALLKARGAYAQRLTDAAYESLAQASEPPPLFVKRGGEMGRVSRSKLKVGEPVYAKFDEGDWQVVGYVDATGQAPPPPLIP